MQKVKRFGEFLNESQEVNEKTAWESIPVIGGWIKARRERKEAEAKAKAEAQEEKLDMHNQKMLEQVKRDYDAYAKQIKKNFKNDPELMNDKMMYLKHFIWACLNDFGWDEKVLKDLHKKGKFDAELKKLMTHETNPRGASWPAYVWFVDLEPDLNDIHTSIVFPARGYSKKYA